VEISIFKTCKHCGLIHDEVCSRIKSIEYYQDGTVKKVEYHDPQNIVPNYNFSKIPSQQTNDFFEPTKEYSLPIVALPSENE
jgi:hypothetical protein